MYTQLCQYLNISTSYSLVLTFGLARISGVQKLLATERQKSGLRLSIQTKYF